MGCLEGNRKQRERERVGETVDRLSFPPMGLLFVASAATAYEAVYSLETTTQKTHACRHKGPSSVLLALLIIRQRLMSEDSMR